MIRNYFLISFRNMLRHKGFSAINILGLAIGMMATFFILEYVAYEFSFDQFHQNYDSIYRVTNDRYQEGDLVQHGTITYAGVGEGLVEDYPEILRSTTLSYTDQIPVNIGSKVYVEDDVLTADENFFQMFDFELLAGDPVTCLTEIRTLTISRTLAEKYFGNDLSPEEIVGKTISVDEVKRIFTITGVFEDMPQNSHLKADMIFFSG